MAKMSMKVKQQKPQNIIDVNFVVDHMHILENMEFVVYVLEN